MAEEENESENEQGSLEETEEPGEKGLGEFVTLSMRGPKRGIYEQLIAQLLIKSNRTNNDLIKIISMCEAALMSRQKDKLDMNHVEICYGVSRSFLNTRPDPQLKHVVRVAWSFPQTVENWEKYIEPWNLTTIRYYPLQTPYRHKNYPKKMRYVYYSSSWESQDRVNKYQDYLDDLQLRIHKEIHELPTAEAFFQETSALSEESYQVLQGEFSNWALRKLSEIKAQIAEEISPQVWREALGISGEEQEEE